MKRLVIVANRVPDPKARGATAGGLAVALQDAFGEPEALRGWLARCAPPAGPDAENEAPSA